MTQFPLSSWLETAEQSDAHLREYLDRYLRTEALNKRLAKWVVGKELIGIRELRCLDFYLAYPANSSKLNFLRGSNICISTAPPLIVRLETNGSMGIADGINRITLYRERQLETCFGLILRA